MEKQKSRQTALLLAFFFGTVGAHRFYLRRKVSGFLQLGLTLYFSFINDFQSDIIFFAIFLWVIVDLVLILSGKLKELQK